MYSWFRPRDRWITSVFWLVLPIHPEILVYDTKIRKCFRRSSCQMHDLSLLSISTCHLSPPSVDVIITHSLLSLHSFPFPPLFSYPITISRWHVRTILARSGRHCWHGRLDDDLLRQHDLAWIDADERTESGNVQVPDGLLLVLLHLLRHRWVDSETGEFGRNILDILKHWILKGLWHFWIR